LRLEVVEFQRQRQRGDVLLLQPVPAMVLFPAILLAAALIVVFLFHAQYNRMERVIGQLVPPAGVVRVFPPATSRPGTIISVDIVQGQEVAAGQLLFTVVVDRIDSRGVNVDAANLDYEKRRRNLLDARIATQEQSATI
jgi:membrane fusion protein